jgi:molybdopterin-binding protein
MKLSARNALKGTVISVIPGATTTHVKLAIGGGMIVTSAITNESATELGLKPGVAAVAIIKSSDVIIGVE